MQEIDGNWVYLSGPLEKGYICLGHLLAKTNKSVNQFINQKIIKVTGYIKNVQFDNTNIKLIYIIMPKFHPLFFYSLTIMT